MLNEVFKEEMQEAEITIKVGDYVMEIKGQMHPPVVETERFENDIYSHGFYRDSRISSINEMSLKVRPTSEVTAKQWRWTVPVAIPPRIEEE